MAHAVQGVADVEAQALASTTQARFGAPTLLFNNARVSSGGLVWEHTEAD